MCIVYSLLGTRVRACIIYIRRGLQCCCFELKAIPEPSWRNSSSAVPLFRVISTTAKQEFNIYKWLHNNKLTCLNMNNLKILFVIDLYDNDTNGTTVSAKRFAEALRKDGHIVRILATGEAADYQLAEYHLPLFDNLVHQQGFTFGRTNKRLMEEAIAWADIVHFYMPFGITVNGLKICQKMRKPHTAAFHVQPENIISSIGLKDANRLIDVLYGIMRRLIFDNFEHVHCPSQLIADRLKRSRYQSTLHVISNGVLPEFKYNKCPKSDQFKDRFVIMMVGRLSQEKCQHVLIEAIQKSKYSDRIQLILAGQGPMHDRYEILAKRLPVMPILEYFSKEQLINLFGQADLYVHSSDIETEAIGCIEAFACGLVPVISDSDRCAARQFAIDDRSLFLHGDSTDLAQKIDYWIEHDDEKKVMEKQYAQLAKQYSLESSVQKFERMLQRAIHDYYFSVEFMEAVEKYKAGRTLDNDVWE